MAVPEDQNRTLTEAEGAALYAVRRFAAANY
jgi:hypothetical protein